MTPTTFNENYEINSNSEASIKASENNTIIIKCWKVTSEVYISKKEADTEDHSYSIIKASIVAKKEEQFSRLVVGGQGGIEDIHHRRLDFVV